MAGRAPLDIEKPLPVAVAMLTVTGALPVDVSVRGSVTPDFKPTLPNDKLEALMLSVGIAAFSCRATLFETPFADAVSVTD